eukprot:TRINITY_DN34704_c0_g1_i1.p2 TRINITY_DN34704_c0_g1~~TRINITY_DN34704_c0_g1_i1.p2  ORF type:complete len:112 (+),score=7.45 TRINITY_DN34704_c0_g1_i1:605-940(+)
MRLIQITTYLGSTFTLPSYKRFRFTHISPRFLEVQKSDKGLLFNQYTQDLIVLARLQDFAPVDTALQLNVKYRKDHGNPLTDPKMYRKVIANPVYSTITQLNIFHAINITS